MLDDRARGGGAGAGAGAAVVIETAGLSSDGARRCGGRSGSKAAGGLASCAAGAHAAGSAAAASFRASWKPSSIDILDGRERRPKCCALFGFFVRFGSCPERMRVKPSLPHNPQRPWSTSQLLLEATNAKHELPLEGKPSTALHPEATRQSRTFSTERGCSTPLSTLTNNHTTICSSAAYLPVLRTRSVAACPAAAACQVAAAAR